MGDVGSAGSAEPERRIGVSSPIEVPPSRRDLPPTAIERLLASGRRLTRRERDRLTGLAARRRAAAEGTQV